MNEFSVGFADWKEDGTELIAVRSAVFVDEQKVPENLEVDAKDPHCLHIKALNRAGRIIGTARLLPSHYIGRMCVLKAFRNRGVGGAILEFILDYAIQNSIKRLKLNAQVTALPFYQRYGFNAKNDVFDEAGIAHQLMVLSLFK